MLKGVLYCFYLYICLTTDKNKSSMNKRHELFEIIKDVKRGNKMAAEAYDEILLLFKQ